MRARLTVVLVCASCLLGCKSDSELARKDLAALGIPYGDEALVNRIKDGDEVAVRLLVRAGVPLTGGPEGEETPLQVALSFNKRDIADFILENGGVVKRGQLFVDVFRLGSNLRRSRIEAFDRFMSPPGEREKWQTLFCSGLLDKGLGVDLPANGGVTGLLAAVAAGNQGAVKVFLKANGNPNVVSERGESPLTVAIGNGNVDIVRDLVAAKATLAGRPEAVASSLCNAASMGRSDILAIAREKGAEFNCLKDGLSPLANAVAHRQTSAVEWLLKNGAKANVEGEKRSPLAEAINTGQSALARQLLESGAVPDGLDQAVAANDLSLVDLLLAKGARPQGTIISSAVWEDIEIVERLLKAGADPNARSDPESRTPLMKAACLSDPGKALAMTQLLLQNGADPNGTIEDVVHSDYYIREREWDPFARRVSRTALAECERCASAEVKQLLRQHGAR